MQSEGKASVRNLPQSSNIHLNLISKETHLSLKFSIVLQVQNSNLFLTQDKWGSVFYKKEQKKCLPQSARTNTLECFLNFISQTSEKKICIFYLEAEIHYSNFSKLQVGRLVYASDLFISNKDIKLGNYSSCFS